MWKSPQPVNIGICRLCGKVLTGSFLAGQTAVEVLMANEPEEFEEEEVDVEELLKQGKPIPRAKRYRIRIGREKYVVHRPIVTGRSC